MGQKQQEAVVLLTVDPTSPNETVIGYSSNFDQSFTPIGCSGAAVLGAVMSAGFKIEEVVSGDDYVQYTLVNKKFSNKERAKLSNEFENLPCEPIT